MDVAYPAVYEPYLLFLLFDIVGLVKYLLSIFINSNIGFIFTRYLSLQSLKTLAESLDFGLFVDIHKIDKRINVKAHTYGSKFEIDKDVKDEIDSSSIETVLTTNTEPMVLINHARTSLKKLMIEKGICYLRAGDSKGSVLVQSGFERMQYVLLHTAGNEPLLFKLKTKGMFQIWTKETLIENGFNPRNAPYYVVLHFDNLHPVQLKKCPRLIEDKNTYRAKIKKLSEFV